MSSYRNDDACFSSSVKYRLKLILGSALLSLSTLLLSSAPSENSHDLLWEDLLLLKTDPGQVLDHESVRLSGYLLPLVISGSEVTEFLLVPHVGVCVQELCPSTDQLVYVVPGQGIEVEGVFDPIRVTGSLMDQSSTHDLSVLNQEEEITAAYQMRADLVELY